LGEDADFRVIELDKLATGIRIENEGETGVEELFDIDVDDDEDDGPPAASTGGGESRTPSSRHFSRFSVSCLRQYSDEYH
jgi:hypothetical protein